MYIPEELGNILNTPLQQYTGTPTATEDTPTPPTSPALAASHPPTLQLVSRSQTALATRDYTSASSRAPHCPPPGADSWNALLVGLCAALRSTRRTAWPPTVPRSSGWWDRDTSRPSNRAGLHGSTRVAKDVAYEFLWQVNDITRDELKNSVVKEEAERVARRCYYEIARGHFKVLAIQNGDW